MAGIIHLGAQGTGRRSDIESRIRSCEQELGVSITIHDLHGVCRDLDGHGLLTRRGEHRQPLCRLGRQDSMPGCLAHCKDLAHAHAGRTRTPFASTCWKGIREIIVKLARDGVVSAVLFAGAWRTARSAPETDVPKLDQARELHRTLPLWDQTRGLKLARHLTTWGQGLMQLLDSFRWDIGTSRSAIIRRFIARCAHRPTSLAELANELGCPVSRADHIVVEELGTSFRELLQNERIDRAKFLLSSGPGSLADVAEACGFRNEYSFNRVFTRNVGMPPGRWRKGQVTGP